jgi:hypothetical protein
VDIPPFLVLNPACPKGRQVKIREPNRREGGGGNFLEDRLQDDGAIRVKSIVFIADYALVLPKKITWKGNLHDRCGGLKPC